MNAKYDHFAAQQKSSITDVRRIGAHDAMRPASKRHAIAGFSQR
jgi:hypothetical protein